MFRFNLFNDFALLHGITDRTGGASKGSLGGTNTNFYNEKYFFDACRDIKMAIDKLGMSAKTIIATRQIHSCNILNIDREFDFEGLKKYDTSETALAEYRLFSAENVDGIMTDRNDVILLTFYADCVPILIYDKEKKAMCSIHSGWRGTANGFLYLAVEEMKKEYNTNSRDLLVGIGQAAGKCCYEVDDAVRNEFLNGLYKKHIDELFIENRIGHYLLDIKNANYRLAENLGIYKDNVEMNPDCTICNSDIYHSHRAANGKERGTMGLICQLV